MAVDTTLPAKADIEQQEAVAVFQKPRLAWHDAIGIRFKHIGVTKASWITLIDACYPNAKTVDTILMVLQYCDARTLDPFKRPVNIVQMYSSTKDNGEGQRQGGYVDTVWPSIAELRITAHRTKDYAGCDRVVWGPTITRKFAGNVEQWENRQKVTKLVEKEVTFPEYAQITMYRWVHGERVAFHGPEVYWLEAYATVGKTDLPNDMWENRARGQLEKCAEAAGLRRAFPEEIGNDYAAEEMEGRSWNVHEIRDITPRAEPMKQIASDPPEPTRKAAAEPAKQPDKKTEAKPKAERKPDTKAAPEVAKEPAKPAVSEVDQDTYNVTDYPAYADEFETKILECEGDIDAMLLVWKEHEMYDDSLPIEFRTKCREIYQRAGGEFPE